MPATHNVGRTTVARLLWNQVELTTCRVMSDMKGCRLKMSAADKNYTPSVMIQAPAPSSCFLLCSLLTSSYSSSFSETQESLTPCSSVPFLPFTFSNPENTWNVTSARKLNVWPFPFWLVNIPLLYHLDSWPPRVLCEPRWALTAVGWWSWMKRISYRGWGTLEQLCHFDSWQGGHPGQRACSGQREPLFHGTSGSQ